MPNQFLSPDGDLENYFLTDYWLIDQYIGDQLWCWGYNYFGRLGQNDIGTVASPGLNSRSTPRQTGTATNWKQISFTSAIKTDGTLWSWGFNSFGELGDNTTASRSTPRQIGTATNWKQVTVSSAIKTDGTLWTWGYNEYGTVGDNTTNARSTPRQEFTSSTNWKQTSSSGTHSLAIKTDGTLWAWGYNRFGQIGDNTAGSAVSFGANSRSTPRQIGTATNWKQITAFTFHSVGIKTDGTLWAWGRNYRGQLGDNTTIDRSTPRQEITSSTNWRQVFQGTSQTTYAIKTDGTLWAWGRGDTGRIGNNATLDRSTPVQEFTSSTNWKQVSSAYGAVSAIKTDGTLWSWGSNLFGQIGDNTTNSRSTPRQEFTSSTNWKQCSGSLAIKTGIEMDTGTITT